jgi:hypothetical protein
MPGESAKLGSDIVLSSSDGIEKGMTMSPGAIHI